MISALASAAAGLHDAFTRLDRVGERIARNGAEPDDMVELISARHQVGANAAVVRVEDEMIGSLLDVLA